MLDSIDTFPAEFENRTKSGNLLSSTSLPVHRNLPNLVFRLYGTSGTRRRRTEGQHLRKCIPFYMHTLTDPLHFIQPAHLPSRCDLDMCTFDINAISKSSRL